MPTDGSGTGSEGSGTGSGRGVGVGVGCGVGFGVGRGVGLGVGCGVGATVGVGARPITLNVICSVGNWPDPQFVVPELPALSNASELHVMGPGAAATPVIVNTARSTGGVLPTNG